MTWFDYAVLAIVGASLFLGLWRGVVSELLALVAWVAAFVAARLFAPELSGLFAALTSDKTVQHLAAFAAVFVGVLIVFGIGRMVIAKLLHAVGLGLIDRGLGAAFGVARGVLVCLLAVMAGGVTHLPHQPWWRDSSFAPPLETAVVAAKPWLPAILAKNIHYR